MPAVEQHAIVAFNSQLFHAAQQKRAKVAGTFMQEQLRGEQTHFHTLGTANFIKQTARAQAITPQEVSRVRRSISRDTYRYAEIFDEDDELTLQQFFDVAANGQFINNIVSGAHRQMDATAITSFDATAQGGKDGTSTFAWSTDQDVLVGVHEDFVGSGSSFEIATDATAGYHVQNMNVGKFRRALTILKRADVDGPFTCVLHPNAEEALMDNIRVTSRDYQNTVVMNGNSLASFMGVNIITSTLIAVASNVRHSFMYGQQSHVFGMFKNIRTTVSNRPDLGDATQVLVKVTVAATRLFENKSVRIISNEVA